MTTAALCLLAYWRALELPLISDDYLQIQLARQFGTSSGWEKLADDVLYRSRATSLVLTYWTERWFGLDPQALNWTSLLLHILNTWLVLALGVWPVIGWRVSFPAACLFAFSHQHQEAVIWYSALPELLVFFFSVAALLCWALFLQASRRRGWLYGACALCFLAALLSKESAVVLVPLMALAAAERGSGWRRAALGVLPFAALALVYFGAIYAARSSHLHFNDAGTFRLGWHFAPVLARSVLRLFWFWGLMALGALWYWRAGQWNRLLAVAGLWTALTLLPYSFLTYMPFVPSRHTYFASVGWALVVAAAFLTAQERWRRPRAAWVLAVLILVHHCAYLWTRKHRQYVERAAPTERLVECAQGLEGKVHVRCFPYDSSVARLAVELRVGRKIELIVDDAQERESAAPTIDLCASSPCSVPGPAITAALFP